MAFAARHKSSYAWSMLNPSLLLTHFLVNKFHGSTSRKSKVSALSATVLGIFEKLVKTGQEKCELFR